GQQRPSDVRRVSGAHIIQETRGIVSDAAEREREYQRRQENPNGVVPVEELKRIILHAFVGIGPRPPADRRDHNHRQGAAECLRSEHEAPYFRLRQNAAAPAGLVDLMNANTSSRFDMARAPTLVQHSAAHALAKIPTRCWSQPCSSAEERTPMHASHAPVVSPTSGLNAGTRTFCLRLAIKHPSAPM